MSEKITPMCRYHAAVPLRRAAIKADHHGDIVVNEFTAIGIYQRGMLFNKLGYIAVVFECPLCSYVELHDPDKL